MLVYIHVHLYMYTDIQCRWIQHKPLTVVLSIVYNSQTRDNSFSKSEQTIEDYRVWGAGKKKNFNNINSILTHGETN